MNFSLALRQLFSYLLPGGLGLILVVLSFVFGAGMQITEAFDLLQVGEGKLDGALITTAVLGLGVSYGILLSPAMPLCGLLSKKLGKGKADLTPLYPEKIREHAAFASTESKEEIFFFTWSVTKQNESEDVEFPMFAVFAMNFGARYLMASAVAVVVFAVCQTVLISTAKTKLSVSGQSISFLIVVSFLAILALHGFGYYRRIYRLFAVRMFSAIYATVLTEDQKTEIESHVSELAKRMKSTPDVVE